VRQGDTLSGISAQFGVTEDELMAANGMTDPNRLFAGQELRIPASSGS
jgi:LysM repeat protein